MKKKNAITLVKNGTVLYPFTERDYEELQALGCPITSLTTEYLPLLKTYARRTGRIVQTVPFEPIEAEMFGAKVTPKWKHGLAVTQDSVTLTYTKEESEERVEKLIEALKRWYRNHYVTFEVQIKRSKTKVVVTMKKKYGQPT
jgi:hypothetical protein